MYVKLTQKTNNIVNIKILYPKLHIYTIKEWSKNKKLIQINDKKLLK